MRRVFLILTTLVFAGTAAAQEDNALFDLGGDAFRAGGTVTFEAEGVDDLFIAGETVTARSDIGGSAHLAGRDVAMQGAVGGDLYAAGMDVRITGPVAGDATVAGYEVSAGEVGGDLRITGSEVTVSGPVAGYVLAAGEEVTLNGVVEGDMNVAAERLDFGEDARVAGTLTLYEEEPGALEVPDSVAPADRILRRQIEEWDSDWDDARPFDLSRAVAAFLLGVILVAGLAALVASVVPEELAAMRRKVLARPFKALWIGFLSQSVLVGSAVLLAMTLIGILLSPAAILVAVIAGFAGYVIGAYAFGVGLLLAVGRSEPDSIGDRALAAGVGALAAGILGLVPLLGWLFVLALTLAGVGAIAERLFRPRFLSDEA